MADWEPRKGEANLTGELVPSSPGVARPPLSPAGPSLAENGRQLSELVPSEGLAVAEEETIMQGGLNGEKWVETSASMPPACAARQGLLGLLLLLQAGTLPGLLADSCVQ